MWWEVRQVSNVPLGFLPPSDGLRAKGDQWWIKVMSRFVLNRIMGHNAVKICG